MDMYIFEILVCYVESLTMAHSDDKSLGKVTVFTSYNHSQ